jgi:hypothetical protein
MNKVIPLYKGFFTTISGKDFDLISKYKRPPHSGDKKGNSYYASTQTVISGHKKTIKLHKFITNPGEFVDHFTGKLNDV